MNDRSATTIPGAYGRSSARRSRTLVRSSTVTRSSVAQRPGELSVADVDRHHVRDATAEQAVGEATGRGARIERRRGRRRRARTDRARPRASPAPGREASGLPDQLDGRGGVDQGGRLARRAAGDQDQPVADGALRLAAGGDEAAAHELGVESPARHGDRRQACSPLGLDVARLAVVDRLAVERLRVDFCPARARARAPACAARRPRRATRRRWSSAAT